MRADGHQTLLVLGLVWSGPLAAHLSRSTDPVEAGSEYWSHVAATAATFAPLFYELSAHAMYGKPHADRVIAEFTTMLRVALSATGAGSAGSAVAPTPQHPPASARAGTG